MKTKLVRIPLMITSSGQYYAEGFPDLEKAAKAGLFKWADLEEKIGICPNENVSCCWVEVNVMLPERPVILSRAKPFPSDMDTNPEEPEEKSCLKPRSPWSSGGLPN